LRPHSRNHEPDKYVVLGNHRDAWVFGAVDPSSGSATQLELARVLGGLAREGKRPRRSIVFTSWDAEEWHLTGSTEWGEQFEDDLRKNAIAYLNVDGLHEWVRVFRGHGGQSQPACGRDGA
jgi:Zn-dependent M28 family amino/carboxypeptidase